MWNEELILFLKKNKQRFLDNFNIIFIFGRYFFSWRDPALQGVEEDWLGARNFCRQRCMDSVSLETSNENDWIKQRIVDGKVSEIFYFICIWNSVKNRFK